MVASGDCIIAPASVPRRNLLEPVCSRRPTIARITDDTVAYGCSLPEDQDYREADRCSGERGTAIEFWQEQGDEAIFAAAWEMVELPEEISHSRKPTLPENCYNS
jgi:hypothetical protein